MGMPSVIQMTKSMPALAASKIAAAEKAGVLSFVMDGVHPHDIGTILDTEGIAVRAGHHCAQPLMESLGLEATTRASLALYNGAEDTAAFLDALADAIKVLR